MYDQTGHRSTHMMAASHYGNYLISPRDSLTIYYHTAELKYPYHSERAVLQLANKGPTKIRNKSFHR